MWLLVGQKNLVSQPPRQTDRQTDKKGLCRVAWSRLKMSCGDPNFELDLQYRAFQLGLSRKRVNQKKRYYRFNNDELKHCTKLLNVHIAHNSSCS